jgi:hypothetical protein
MAKTQSKLNNSKSEVIEENILKENPEGLPNSSVVVAKHIPTLRKIVFLNGRDPGCALQFHYSTKTHPLHQYTLYHGYEHELPEEVIEHLEGCAERIYGYRKNPEGHPEPYVKSLKYIFQCKPVKKAA